MMMFVHVLWTYVNVVLMNAFIHCRQNGFDVRSYRYYNADTCLANFGAMCEDLKVITRVLNHMVV